MTCEHSRFATKVTKTRPIAEEVLDGRELTPELAREFIRELEDKGNSPSSATGPDLMKG